jgi:hypothetical protein
MRLSPRQGLVVAIGIAAVVAAVTVVVSFPSQQNEPTVAQDTNGTEARDVIYTAKFECGTISGDEGPLRPGHYDTDIGILNKQEFPVQFTWTVVVDDGRPSNPIIKSLQPQTSTSIVCNDLEALFGDQKFTEGFVIFNVPVSGEVFSSDTAIVGRQEGVVDILDVQVFYTVNSLEGMPQEVLVDKIVFVVESDPSGMLPDDIIGKTHDVTVRSSLDEISNPVERVRAALAEKYGLSAEQASGLEINIEMISVGAGMTIDNHALTLSRVPPQTSS